MNDKCLIATAYNGEARIYVSKTTNLVEASRQIHHTWPTATAALGRFLTASVMMGLMYKNEESITLRIESDGPIGYMTVEANASGEVRADIKNPEVYLTYNSGINAGKLAVGKAVGDGFLHITKDLKMKQMFTSSVELQTGEIGDDFTYYFTSSEQTPSAVGLGVLVNLDESVKQAGGFIIQLMPFATEKTISTIESIISTLKSVTDIFESGTSIEGLLSILSADTHQLLLEKALFYKCHCSKEKFALSLSKIDKQTIDAMIYEDKGAEIICHFCHNKYTFSVDELIALKTK